MSLPWHDAIAVGGGVSLAAGTGLLWLGLIRLAGQSDDPHRRRLGKVLTAAGVLVTAIAIGIGKWLHDNPDVDFAPSAHSRFSSLIIGGVLTVAAWLGQCLVLTHAYRNHRHELTPVAARLLALAMGLSWGFVPLSTLILNMTIRITSVVEIMAVNTLRSLIYHLGFTLPVLVLGWLLVTGKLLWEPTAATTTPKD